jgi:hypothetical protein
VKHRRATMIAVTLIMTVGVAACGTGGDDDSGQGDTTTQNRTGKMDEQQATMRAEQIIHQAVDVMSPKPQLKKAGPQPVGPCLADDGTSTGNRQQVVLIYQLTGVPGSAAKTLVRQARDAWVKQGYKFSSKDADWDDPSPKVYMRTPSDDFWMDAIVGVTDKEKGEGIAALTVTSPCFSAESNSADS